MHIFTANIFEDGNRYENISIAIKSHILTFDWHIFIIPLTHSKGQGQALFDYKYLGNGERYGKQLCNSVSVITYVFLC